MIRVGFLLNFPVDYKGGINYFKNLFYAVNKYKSDEVKIILFVPTKLEEEYISIFKNNAQIIKTRILDRKSFLWLCSKLGAKILGYDYLTSNLLKANKIDVISHSNYVFSGKKIKSINWIPDFQYIHYPKLWSKKQLHATDKLHKKLIKKSDGIVLSSLASFEDFKLKYSTFENKVSILNFVSQPNGELRIKLTPEELNSLKEKYKINREFFYLPNQFWTHKNHSVVFHSIKQLKEKGYKPLLITSGFMNDYRNGNNHIYKLKQFVKDHQLQDYILFLGLIPYRDVIDLMICSNCIINPSRFEGWSSTVEEAKTMGKYLLLSNINVHKEQSPQFGTFFNPNDSIDLTHKMADIIDNFNKQKLVDLTTLKDDLEKRTKDFASNYLNILNKIVEI